MPIRDEVTTYLDFVRLARTARRGNASNVRTLRRFVHRMSPVAIGVCLREQSLNGDDDEDQEGFVIPDLVELGVPLPVCGKVIHIMTDRFYDEVDTAFLKWDGLPPDTPVFETSEDVKTSIFSLQRAGLLPSQEVIGIMERDAFVPNVLQLVADFPACVEFENAEGELDWAELELMCERVMGTALPVK